MKNILILIAFLATYSAIAQNDEAYVDELTQEFTKKLMDRGIDDFFISKQYCSGKIEMFLIGEDKKRCTSKGTYFEVYVVWQEDEVSRIKKIDNCGLFYSEELLDDALITFFESNAAALKTEEVKKYKSSTYSGKPELRKTPQPCHRNYTFTESGVSQSKRYNLFDISNDSDGSNLNFEYNNNLKMVQLDAMLKSVLTNLDGKMRRQL